jgi:HSP20 family protein
MIVIRRTRPRSQTRRHANIDPLYQALISGSGVGERGRRVWRPPVEVFETADALEIVAEIAGMQGQDIDVVIEGDVLTIEGTRPDPSNCEHRLYHIARIGYGPFAADVQLPFSVDTEDAEASYDNGFLHVRLPRTRTRTIVPTRGSTSMSGNGSDIDVDTEQRDA